MIEDDDSMTELYWFCILRRVFDVHSSFGKEVWYRNKTRNFQCISKGLYDSKILATTMKSWESLQVIKQLTRNMRLICLVLFRKDTFLRWYRYQRIYYYFFKLQLNATIRDKKLIDEQFFVTHCISEYAKSTVHENEFWFW